MSQLQEDTRQTVLERDEYRCQFCGVTDEQHKDEKGRSLDIHHAIPRRAGGSDDPENLIPVCVECHRTLEATQGDALERIRNDVSDCTHEDEIEELKEKCEMWKQHCDREKNSHSDTIGAVEELLKESLQVTFHVVHETRLNTSRLLYAGTDKERAANVYSNAENHVTMESVSITVDDWFDGINDERVDSIAGDTKLRPMLKEEGVIEVESDG